MNKRKSDTFKMTAPDGQSVAQWELDIKNEVDRKEINFPKPNEVGCYSVNGRTKEFQDNNHLLNNIFVPPSGWNAKLSEGFQWNLKNCPTEAIKFDYENRRHDTYNLEWILRHQEEIRSVFMDLTSNDVKIDFICNRNVLKNMCLTQGTTKRKSDWTFYACKFQSTIYMRPLETDHPKEETKKDNNREHWGDVFEKYMTISNKDDEIAPVNKNEGVYIMLKGQMNEHTLLYSAEVDGRDPNIPQKHLDSHGFLKSTDCYIELKLGNERLQKNYFYSGKLVYWWLQAVLGGIPKIICGIRNEDGMVKELKTFHVKMEKESAEKGKRKIRTVEGSGKTKAKRQKTEKLECGRMETKDEGTVIYLDDTKEACLKTCAKILDFVKKCVQDDNRGTVYKFQHKDKESFVTCEKLNDPVKYEKILPKWYTDQSRNPL